MHSSAGPPGVHSQAKSQALPTRKGTSMRGASGTPQAAAAASASAAAASYSRMGSEATVASVGHSTRQPTLSAAHHHHHHHHRPASSAYAHGEAGGELTVATMPSTDPHSRPHLADVMGAHRRVVVCAGESLVTQAHYPAARSVVGMIGMTEDTVRAGMEHDARRRSRRGSTGTVGDDDDDAHGTPVPGAGAGRDGGRQRLSEALQRLARLHRSGELSDQEYAAAKARVIHEDDSGEHITVVDMEGNVIEKPGGVASGPSLAYLLDDYAPSRSASATYGGGLGGAGSRRASIQRSAAVPEPELEEERMRHDQQVTALVDENSGLRQMAESLKTQLERTQRAGASSAAATRSGGGLGGGGSDAVYGTRSYSPAVPSAGYSPSLSAHPFSGAASRGATSADVRPAAAASSASGAGGGRSYLSSEPRERIGGLRRAPASSGVSFSQAATASPQPTPTLSYASAGGLSSGAPAARNITTPIPVSRSLSPAGSPTLRDPLGQTATPVPSPPPVTGHHRDPASQMPRSVSHIRRSPSRRDESPPAPEFEWSLKALQTSF
eukprot:Rhum_TRINITY_DN14426_c3_g2::Rhum_TRINITY_DN14426_c3_g2_i1::g.87166::m.87166